MVSLFAPKKGPKRSTFGERACFECGEPFQPSREDQRFCPGGQCKAIEKNRRFNRAIALYPWVYAMVCERDVKRRGELLTAISQQARRWRDEDRRLGRPAPVLPADWPNAP